MCVWFDSGALRCVCFAVSLCVRQQISPQCPASRSQAEGNLTPRPKTPAAAAAAVTGTRSDVTLQLSLQRGVLPPINGSVGIYLKV